LITGRTSIYLLDPNKADTNAKKRCASIQAHEVAHMWFGNITTMEWWNYLYLNEGFASLMGEVIVMERAYPEWRADSSFITDHLNRALTLDAKLSSHPIEVDCPNANDIGQIFDDLSYSKAASGPSSFTISRFSIHSSLGQCCACSVIMLERKNS
jgi:aminopeptidase 2